MKVTKASERVSPISVPEKAASPPIATAILTGTSGASHSTASKVKYEINMAERHAQNLCLNVYVLSGSSLSLLA